MKSKEYFIDRYRKQKKELESTGEIWRLCQETEEIFVEKLDEIYQSNKEGHYLNEFHRESTFNIATSLLLQKKLSIEEMQDQMDRHRVASEQNFLEQAPQIKESVSKLKTPLTISDLSQIYRWIFRKQITLDDLPNEVIKEFKESKQYKSLVDRKII